MDWIKWWKKCQCQSQSSVLNKWKCSYCKSKCKCNILLDNICVYCESKALLKISINQY